MNSSESLCSCYRCCKHGNGGLTDSAVVAELVVLVFKYWSNKALPNQALKTGTYNLLVNLSEENLVFTAFGIDFRKRCENNIAKAHMKMNTQMIRLMSI